MAKTLLASAPNLSALQESITRFYAGEEKILIEDGEGKWRVAFPDGQELIGVHVVKRGRRFRFEMVI